jgi:methionine-rich copper-binding protein CopC
MLKRTRLYLASLLCSLLVAAVPAFAHSHPKTMTPDKDSVVSAPTEVSIFFSEDLEPKFSSLMLLNAKGDLVSKVPSEVDPKDAKHQTLALPTLAPGVYTVKWVTTAADGHHLEGKYDFTVK